VIIYEVKHGLTGTKYLYLVKKFLQLQQKPLTSFNFFSHRLVACAFREPNEVFLLGYRSVIFSSRVEGTVIPLLN